MDCLHTVKQRMPGTLEEALGYQGKLRYVAFYWGEDDHPHCTDGSANVTLTNDQAFIAFCEHAMIWPTLKEYNIGLEKEGAAECWLLLDRKERRLAVCLPDQTFHYLSDKQEHYDDTPDGETERIETRIAREEETLKRLLQQLDELHQS